MISVVLAVHNEEKNLARCLKAVRKIADEIVVVDGESTDRTVEIAQSFDAKIITTTNKANFHINKQIAIDAAEGQLILQLDADEVVDEELLSFISNQHDRLLKNPTAIDVSAWYIPRKNLFLGNFLRKGGQYPDAVIRLFIKGQARLPQKDVHEQMAVDGKVEWAQGHLIHYANPSFADYMRKWQTYTQFKADQLVAANLKPSPLNFVSYVLLKPSTTWFSLFIRHRGYIDGVAGFVFAVMSGLHHAFAYLLIPDKKASHG